MYYSQTPTYAVELQEMESYSYTHARVENQGAVKVAQAVTFIKGLFQVLK